MQNLITSFGEALPIIGTAYATIVGVGILAVLGHCATHRISPAKFWRGFKEEHLSYKGPYI